MKKIFLFLLCLTPLSALAWQDPTGGKPFFPWVWEDQLKPTLKKSVDGEGVTILAIGTGITWGTRVYDHKIFDHHKVHSDMLIGKKDSEYWGKVGNGLIGASVAGLQLVFDQSNGLKTVRTLLLASTSHIMVSAVARRNRPENKTDFLSWPSSFPSGHTTSAFALAGSLAYSYGMPVGIPVYIAAAAIGLSRIKEERHWASDVVAGAVIGTFWARASFEAEEKKDQAMIVPVKVGDGLMLMAVKDF